MDVEGTVRVGGPLGVELVLGVRREGTDVVNINSAIVGASYKELVELALVQLHTLAHRETARAITQGPEEARVFFGVGREGVNNLVIWHGVALWLEIRDEGQELGTLLEAA